MFLHPNRIHAPCNRAGLSFIGVPWKIVLHTTESTADYSHNPNSYFGHNSWPHCTIDRRGIHQHLPINVGAFALARTGVDTNRANAIQCEIVWRAADIHNLPAETLAHVVDWVTWVCKQTGAPMRICPQGFLGQNQGIVLASESSPIRFSDRAWLDFSGICGHQHVPSGNDHWDPGRFPVTAFAKLMNREEDDMFTDDDRNALNHVRTVLDELKRELSQAAGTDDWHQVGERLREKLAQ